MHFRWLLLACAFMPALTWADECEDDFSGCQDDCMLQFGGSIREDMKSKFVKCLRKCTRVSTACHERNTETKVNHLNEGALDKSPGSRDVDEDGMPVLKRRPEAKPPKQQPKPKEVSDDEVVGSERTRLVTEKPTPAPAPVVKKRPAPPPRDEPPPKPKPAPKKDDDDDLRNY